MSHYNEGYLAGEAGTKSSHNPHQHGTAAYKEWQAGWSSAQDDWHRTECELEAYNDWVIILVMVIILLSATGLLAKVLGWL